MHQRVFVLSLVALAACSNSSLEIERRSQAATFPASSDWIPLEQAGNLVGDVSTDGNNNGRELVGDENFAAVFVFSDGTDFFLRMRLDATPAGGGQAVVAPFGWGLLIDSNNNLNAYEFLIMLDGTGPDQIVFAQNTVPGTIGDPNDPAEVDLFVIAADDALGGNVSISLAETTINGTADFFLDFAIPMSVLNAAGLDMGDSVRFIAGTSNNGRSLSVDLMNCDDGAGSCSLTDAAWSRPIHHLQRTDTSLTPTGPDENGLPWTSG